MKLKLNQPWNSLKEGDVIEIEDTYYISGKDQGGTYHSIPAMALIGFDPEKPGTDKTVESLITVHQEMKSLNIEFK